jgi:prepilin-type N-terminal cleavage/methylation domain-containing protein
MRRVSTGITWPRRILSGFTLVEVMIALVVLALGITLLAGVAARSARLTHRGRKDLAAAVTMTDRLERLRASVLSAGCGAAAGGTAVLPGGRREVWAVTSQAGSARLVDSIIPSGADSDSAAVLGTTVPCQ